MPVLASVLSQVLARLQFLLKDIWPKTFDKIYLVKILHQLSVVCGRGEYQFADGQKVTVHKDQKSPS